MKAANPDRSARLKRVLGVLKPGKERTTLDIMNQAQVCAVSACVAELRQHGHQINCQRRGDLWFYRMVS